MNTVLKLILVTVLFCKVCCELYEYQLPDNDEIKSLNVTVHYQGFYAYRVECNNYNSLKYFDIQIGDAEFDIQWNKFTFVNCFNNETDNENNNFNLMNLLQKYESDSIGNHGRWSRSSSEVRLIPYAIVNSDVLFGNFMFDRFQNVEIIDVGLTSTTFLNTFNCYSCKFENANQLDFNNFNVARKMERLVISNTKLNNLINGNMRKLKALTHLTINRFSLDDYNTFNVPGLFENQSALIELELTNSDAKIVLHDGVFRGLRDVYYVTLEHLQLDTIPPNLFNDMEKVHVIKLNSNNIKVLATSFEFNPRLTEVHLKANPIFSEPHDKINQLVIGGEMVKFYFENYTVHSRDTVTKLMNNGRIDSLYFESLQTDFKIEDFLNVETSRSHKSFGIVFKRYPSGYLDWDYLNTNGVAHQNTGLRNNINAQISLPISEETCHNCWMMKQFFHTFLTSDKSGFYFGHSRLRLQFDRICTNQIAYFDEEYTENCIPTCKCIYNPLSDQIIIDCRNRNLTEFPIIPYPVQYDYDTIYTIDLHFENNLLRHVSFDGQDENVLQKLGTLDFSNNRIESITMMDREFNNVKRLNLCTNPILDDIRPKKITFKLNYGTYHFDSDYWCSRNASVGNIRLDPNDYVLKTKSANFINQYLNKLTCY